MKTVQTRFFETLDALAASVGCEVIQEPNYSNTGNVAVVEAGTFQVAARFDYSFSTGHNVFHSLRDAAGTALVRNGAPPIFQADDGTNPVMFIARTMVDFRAMFDLLAKALGADEDAVDKAIAAASEWSGKPGDTRVLLRESG